MKPIFLSALGVLLITMTAISQSGDMNAQLVRRADSLFNMSQWRLAIPVYETVIKEQTSPGTQPLSRLAYCYHQTGAYDDALCQYERALEAGAAGVQQMNIRSRIARIYSLKRGHDAAFAELEKALDLGYGSVRELLEHVDFESIRSDKRFEAVVERARLNAFPCMSMQQARLFDFWVGEWDVHPNGGNQVVGFSKIEVASGGCMILENWTALGPRPGEGKSMNYVNPATGKWEQLWVGSGGINAGNPQKFVNGEYRDNAMRFEFEQTGPQGQKLIGRFTFFNLGPQQVRQLNEVSSDDGATWTINYDLIYKRKS